MEVSLYNFSKKHNSTKRPTGDPAEVKTVVLKEGTDIYAPSFVLTAANVSTIPNYTYLKWGNRYYYINSIKSTNAKQLYEISCDLDSLATFRTAVGNTKGFCLFSSSNYSSGLIDNRLSTKKNVTISTSTGHHVFSGDGGYSVHVINNQGNSRFFMGSSTFNALKSLLWEDDLFHSLLLIGTVEFAEYVEKKISNVFDTIAEVKYIPFDCSSTTGGGNVWLGKYNTGITASGLARTKTDSVTVAIPWQYEDFRNRSPFTQLLLYLPGYGVASLNADDFQGNESITINVIFDSYTGLLVYKIGNRYKYECNVASSVPVGMQKGGSGASAVAGTVGAVTSAVSGSVVGTALAGFNTILNALEVNHGSVGSTGSSVAFELQKEIYCTTISHDTSIDPDSIKEVQGRPCNKVVTINTLSGYVQMVNASVDVSAPEQVRTEINSFINGGFYYE